ncbi:septal ring lytic transglycosylase RlpA family protein [Thiobacillus denitrificans]|uniref:Endolytic peptidoglycan transglycosylase RlpA n=1 Tax=Thiobacillus denitrificans TaxID=36861 RepID=A0A106BQY3_THIDE|nr:septal ring lytic transglycosylase RlpA family protein [Thiobacillus denitrificans]KVW96999.1 lipoprotein [Thiobacillus denitrificans]
MKTILILGMAAALALAGCGSSPSTPTKPAPATTAKGGGYYLDDGPEANPPANLDAVADAVPRDEPLHRFANRPYVALGKPYTPKTERLAHREEGLASWYGKRFHGKKTASGEVYDMYAMTAAHPTLPLPSYARVTALDSGKSVVVRINDRGPFHGERVIDLSYIAAHKLGYLQRGSTRVRVESLDPTAYDTRGEALIEGVYLQVGAFSRADNAQQLLARLTHALELDPSSSRVVLNDKLHRVQLGPYPSDDAAHAARARVRERLDLDAVLVRRD